MTVRPPYSRFVPAPTSFHFWQRAQYPATRFRSVGRFVIVGDRGRLEIESALSSRFRGLRRTRRGRSFSETRPPGDRFWLREAGKLLGNDGLIDHWGDLAAWCVGDRAGPIRRWWERPAAEPIPDIVARHVRGPVGDERP